MIFMTIVRYQSISSPSSVLSPPRTHLSSAVCSAGEDERAGAPVFIPAGLDAEAALELAVRRNRLKLIFGSPLYNLMVYIATDYIYNLRIVIILNNDNILHFIDSCRSEMSKDEGVGRVCGMGERKREMRRTEEQGLE